MCVQVPHVKTHRARALFDAGIASVEDLALSPVEQIARALRAAVPHRLQQQPARVVHKVLLVVALGSHAHAHTHTHTHMHACKYICVHMYTHTCTHADTHIYIYIRTFIIYTNKHTYEHAYIHLYVYMFTGAACHRPQNQPGGQRKVCGSVCGTETVNMCICLQVIRQPPISSQ